ncbi:hypothetical protein ACFVH6_30150 [Spirillospora sp. NPDC127200]
MRAADTWRPPDGRVPLYDHARRLHAEHPDGPLPKQGEPFPDQTAREGVRKKGAPDTVAAVARFLGGPPSRDAFEALHSALARQYPSPWHELPGVLEPVVRDADPGLVRRLARLLVDRSPDRYPVTVGLALLEGRAEEQDRERVATIALIGDCYSPPACRILEDLPGGERTLWWLAQRTQNWGRVYPMEALAGTRDPDIRAWLLRHAGTGDILEGYYAGQIAIRCDLRGALRADPVEDALLDGALGILCTLAICHGVGTDLWSYGDAEPVLLRCAELLEGTALSARRLRAVRLLADQLGTGRFAEIRTRYRALV